MSIKPPNPAEASPWASMRRETSPPGEASPLILAVETSCDDTCAAVVTGDGEIRANVISSQGVHDRYGGVVPEVASRHHLELATPVIDDALARAGATLDDIGLVAVTAGPGLVGALLVGVATAKGIAAARGLPLAPVDHLQGHVAANFLKDPAGSAPLEPPFLCLIASGGHTFLARVDEHDSFTVLGATLDDAAGEAIDKGARLLGLPFPGGPHLERLASDGDPGAFAFPTSKNVTGLDFSFAGLKTALLYKVRDLGEEEAHARRADLAAAYQHAIVEQIARRVERALDQTGLDQLAIGGGVAANGPLRERLGALADGRAGIKIPPRELCTDNAAMIASAARWVAPVAFPDYLGLEVHATGQRPL
jgi:N6-L-threonylcarbamoyladenine synthase